MIVVFDSNIWISELGLRSSAASAVKFYLKQEGAHIGLPEVVRLEASAGLRKHLLNSILQVQTEHRKLLAGFGTLKELVLPGESDVDSVIATVFNSLQADILDIPLSVESSRSALQKCITKEPPCDKTEEFRDAILWADCLQILSQDDVYLVTSDKAFYKDRRHEAGLAPNLAEESSNRGHKIHIFPDLSSLLASIKKPVDVSADTIISQYLSKEPEVLRADSLKYSATERSNIEVFVTEIPDQLYLKFELGLICSDTSGQGLSDVLLNVVGEGTYDTQSRLPTVGQIWKEELTWLSGDRSHPATTRVYAYGAAHLGHKDTAHTVRHKLSNEP